MQATDIMFHIHDNLNENQQYEVESQLRNIDGVIAPRFNKEHLLLIYYNLDKINSAFLLGFIKSKGYQATLVGI